MTGLIDFSTDASSNDTAAAPILWQEGQPANTINNSARAMMAALACWRDDNTGALVAVRSSGDVYALTSNQTITAGSASVPGTAARGHTLAFTVDAANQGPATLSPDGCPAKPIRRPLGAELAPGDLSPGAVYRVAFVPSLGAYIVLSPTLATPGDYGWQAAAAVKPGWLVPDGTAVSRTIYAALFAAVGTTYGSGDGSTTFNLPNLIGRTLFAQDAAGTVLAAVNGLAGTLGSVGGAAGVTLLAKHLPSGAFSGSTGAAGGHDHGGSVAAAGSHSHGGGTGAAGSHAHSASTDSQGSHSHSGSAQSAGNHSHDINYNVQNVYGPGSQGAQITTGQAASNSTGQTQIAGAHTHGLAIDPAGAHTHNLTVNPVGDHAHTISADGNHQHTIPAVGDHQHSIAVNLGGQDAAHPNIPPGAIAVLLIKA